MDANTGHGEDRLIEPREAARLFGVSADSVASHKKFSEKYNLPFPLLADEKMEVIG